MREVSTLVGRGRYEFREEKMFVVTTVFTSGRVVMVRKKRRVSTERAVPE